MLNKLAAVLKNAQKIEVCENILLGISRSYHWRGCFLQWGKDIPRDTFASMRKNGEVAVLLDEKEEPYHLVLIDAQDIVREFALN